MIDIMRNYKRSNKRRYTIRNLRRTKKSQSNVYRYINKKFSKIIEKRKSPVDTITTVLTSGQIYTPTNISTGTDGEKHRMRGLCIRGVVKNTSTGSERFRLAIVKSKSGKVPSIIGNIYDVYNISMSQGAGIDKSAVSDYKILYDRMFFMPKAGELGDTKILKIYKKLYHEVNENTGRGKIYIVIDYSNSSSSTMLWDLEYFRHYTDV